MTRDETWNELNRIVANLVCDGDLDEEQAESILDDAQLDSDVITNITAAIASSNILGSFKIAFFIVYYLVNNLIN